VARWERSHRQPRARPLRPEEFKQLVRSYRTAFPDVQLTVDDLIAQDDRVVARWTSRGTHQGEFAGIPPSGRRIEVMGISIFLVQNGQVQEEWKDLTLWG
jgi:steroid delta-isomerase-like uncharacterized protein